MKTYTLSFTLLSDATFGRGDGVAGEVDIETQHDANGCPFLQGRALKGMLVAECADILNALPDKARAVWARSARRLFGEPGSLIGAGALLSLSDAQLPEDLRTAIAADMAERGGPERLHRAEVLDCLTALRRQTAIETRGRQTGVAKTESLRVIRVILRGTRFEAELWLDDTGYAADTRAGDLARDEALLAACVAAFRRAGTGRNRGRGRLEARIDAHEESGGLRPLGALVSELAVAK